MRAATIAMVAIATALACDASPDAAPADDAVPPIASDSITPQDQLFDERVVVFLLADSAELATMRQEHGEEDYYVVADDMMWYRAEAWDWVEQRGIPIVWLEGRPPLRFRVAGATREFDFTDVEASDVVVLYDTDREPLAVAPIEVAERAAAYFPDLPEPSSP